MGGVVQFITKMPEKRSLPSKQAMAQAGFRKRQWIT